MQSTRQIHDAVNVYVFYIVFNFCILFMLIGDMEVRAAGRGRGVEKKKLDVIDGSHYMFGCGTKSKGFHVRRVFKHLRKRTIIVS